MLFSEIRSRYARLTTAYHAYKPGERELPRQFDMKDVIFDVHGKPPSMLRIVAVLDHLEIGEITAFLRDPEDLRKNFFDAMERLRQSLGKDRLRVYVTDVYIDPGYHGRGLGTELYVRIAREASNYDGVIVPQVAIGNATSREALRVWTGSGFKRRVLMSGGVAWGGNARSSS